MLTVTPRVAPEREGLWYFVSGSFQRGIEHFVCWLLPCFSGTDLLRQVLLAATLRQKLQIKLSTSTSHNILTPGQPVSTLTL